MPTTEPIEDLLIQSLQEGSFPATALVQKISQIRPTTTKQGVYRVLRKLKGEEKIVVYGGSVSLNLQWLKKMGEFFSLAQYYYSAKGGNPNSLLGIGEKDKLVYFFKNLSLLDSFASHVLHLLDVAVNPSEPIFAYNPHEWFAYARAEAEEMLINTFNASKRQILITSIYRDPLDKELKKRFNNDLLQYHIVERPLFGGDNYYFVAIGGYLIEIYTDEKIAKELDDFYKRTAIYDNKAKSELLGIITKKGKNKLVISKNRRKIEKYLKALSRAFYIKRRSV